MTPGVSHPRKKDIHAYSSGLASSTGCSAAGLTPGELFDASQVTQHYTEAFLRNPEYTHLPRKFKVTISACLDNCTYPDSQDVGLVPAVKENARENGRVESQGFNVFVGGKQGSGGYTPAQALDVFIPPQELAQLPYSFATTANARITKSHAYSSSSKTGGLKNFGVNWNTAAGSRSFPRARMRGVLRAPITLVSFAKNKPASTTSVW